MKSRKKVKIIRYLLYLVLVTSVITSVSLAKYTAKTDGGASAPIAAFVTDTSLTLKLPLAENLYPGFSQDINFDVTNFEGDNSSQVPLNYEMWLETTGNLPLTFALTGQKAEDDASGAVAQADPNDSLHFTGGKFPSSLKEGKKTHTYTLKIEWPEGENDADYSKEIDQVSIKIKTTQATS